MALGGEGIIVALPTYKPLAGTTPFSEQHEVLLLYLLVPPPCLGFLGCRQ